MNIARKSLLLALLGVLGASSTAAQTASSAANPPAQATLSGIVVKDPGSEPVKKVVIELIAEISSGQPGSNHTAVTAADGTFHIDGIIPGRYRMFAERTGFLEVAKHATRAEGRVLALSAGQELKDVQIRLQAAAVVRGRVVDEDGDPLPNAEVTVLKQTFASGRNRWEQVGGEHTNDLGEYRIPNLAAGNYYLSASPPPDFRSLIEANGTAKPESASAEKPSTSYQTTYYPGTSDRGQAVPIQLHAGDDFPADFALTLSPSLSIRGSVVGLPPRSTAVITLQSREFNLVTSGGEVQKDGSFVIRDISPGAYTIVASVENNSVPMMARQSLQVVNSVDGLRLSPQPGAWIRGRLRLESKSNADVSQTIVLLRAAEKDDVAGSAVRDAASDFFYGEEASVVAADGSFEWKSVPQGNYFVELPGQNGGNAEWYVKSVSIGGRDMNESGISVNGGTVLLDVVASANGGVVDGVAVNAKGDPVPNAVIVAVPEARLRGRDDRYRKAAADQSGRFTLRGLTPGEYTVFAWESLDGDAYLNPDFMKNYEGQGSALHIGENEHKSLQAQVIPVGEDTP